MSVLDKIVKDTKRRIEIEKRKNTVKKLGNFIKDYKLDEYIEKYGKLKLS